MAETEKRTCTYEDCTKPLKARALCDAHYWRFRKYGHPGGGGTKPGPQPKSWWEK